MNMKRRYSHLLFLCILCVGVLCISPANAVKAFSEELLLENNLNLLVSRDSAVSPLAECQHFAIVGKKQEAFTCFQKLKLNAPELVALKEYLTYKVTDAPEKFLEKQIEGSGGVWKYKYSDEYFNLISDRIINDSTLTGEEWRRAYTLLSDSRYLSKLDQRLFALDYYLTFWDENKVDSLLFLNIGQKKVSQKEASSLNPFLTKIYPSEIKPTSFRKNLYMARVFYEAKNYPKAIPLLESLINRGPKYSLKIKLMRKLANACYHSGRFKDASKWYYKLIKEKKGKAMDYLSLARSYKKSGNTSQARKWYNTFQKKFPRHSKTDEIIWVRAFEKEQVNQFDEAIKEYQKLEKNVTANKRRKWAGFRIGFIEFKRGNYFNAINKLKTVESNSDLLLSANAAKFFIAQSYHYSRKDKDAREWFIKTIHDFPTSYYAHRSRQLLEELNLMHKDSIPRLEIMGVGLKETLDWLEKRDSRSNQGVPEKKLEEMERFLGFGLWDLATKKYYEISKKQRYTMKVRFLTSQLFMEYGDVSFSYRIARTLLFEIRRQDMANAPDKVLKLIYPKPYEEKVAESAKTLNIEDNFVYSLMRQESIFDHDIVSPAGAIGLMQIMYGTGKILAREEGIQNFTKEMLANPYISIHLGAKYIANLVEKYDGNKYYVLANYNAGPKPTKRWKETIGDKVHDIFVEEISYWETRNYLKKVMGNFYTYKEIWGGN